LLLVPPMTECGSCAESGLWPCMNVDRLALRHNWAGYHTGEQGIYFGVTTMGCHNVRVVTKVRVTGTRMAATPPSCNQGRSILAKSQHVAANYASRYSSHRLKLQFSLAMAQKPCLSLQYTANCAELSLTCCNHPSATPTLVAPPPSHTSRQTFHLSIHFAILQTTSPLYIKQSRTTRYRTFS
jgi:hypothetical protein